MNRAEHIEWTKTRALEYVEMGDINGAFASFGSDLRKHPETRGHAAVELGMMLMVTGNLETVDQMRKFVEGIQ